MVLFRDIETEIQSVDEEHINRIVEHRGNYSNYFRPYNAFEIKALKRRLTHHSRVYYATPFSNTTKIYANSEWYIFGRKSFRDHLADIESFLPNSGVVSLTALMSSAPEFFELDDDWTETALCLRCLMTFLEEISHECCEVLLLNGLRSLFQ